MYLVKKYNKQNCINSVFLYLSQIKREVNTLGRYYSTEILFKKKNLSVLACLKQEYHKKTRNKRERERERDLNLEGCVTLRLEESCE